MEQPRERLGGRNGRNCDRGESAGGYEASRTSSSAQQLAAGERTMKRQHAKVFSRVFSRQFDRRSRLAPAYALGENRTTAPGLLTAGAGSAGRKTWPAGRVRFV
jgi:hypothetical protein